MHWENPPVPHEVNVSRESVPAEFPRICAGLAVCVLAVAAVLFVAGGWLARQLPFAWETRMVGEQVMGIDLLDAGRDTLDPQRRTRIERQLQDLANELVRGAPLPQGMAVRVHLSDSDVPNAFATLGGHVVVTHGLYRRMPSENALAMVLAHEIGHVRHRDPIAALGGHAAVWTMLALLGGDGQALAGQMAGVVQLGYSRSAETDADDDALRALHATYGHVKGASDVFRVLSGYRAEHIGLDVPTLLSTHPADAARIARIEQAGDGDPAAAVVKPLHEPVERR